LSFGLDTGNSASHPVVGRDHAPDGRILAFWLDRVWYLIEVVLMWYRVPESPTCWGCGTMAPNKLGNPVRHAGMESLPSCINTNVMDY